MNFENQIKDLSAYKNFKSAMAMQKLSQAYLFVSPDKLTNKVFLTEIAKLLQCESYLGCNQCSNCAKINAGTHPDVLVYPAAQTFMVEDASSIYNKVQIKPMLSKHKIFIINNLDLSTEQAQNKMLKILEEPPENVIFLMSACNQEKVLSTILSRVQKATIDRLSSDKIKAIFRDVTEDVLQVALCFGVGYVGKTQDIIENSEFINNYKNMENLLKNMKNSSQIPYFSQYFIKDKKTFEGNLLILNSFFRDMLMLSLNKNNLINNQMLELECNGLTQEFSISAIVEIIKRINLIKKKLDSNVNLTILADNLLFDILEVKYLCK